MRVGCVVTVSIKAEFFEFGFNFYQKPEPEMIHLHQYNSNKQRIQHCFYPS